MSGEGKIVCVTGGSGFIASWLIKYLLSRDYTVRATVLDLKDPNQVEHLVELEGAKARLHLFEANLLVDGSFDLPINGCDGVFHTASPVSDSSLTSKEELVDPAVKGTLNVLGSCARTPTVKRVVVTSSGGTIMFKQNPINPTDVIDETWFSDKEFTEETKQWYILSKILAEEAANKYAREKGIDLVTIHPCLVIGPTLQPTLNYSIQLFMELIKQGKESTSSNGLLDCYVDVRDVANAHIQAFEVPLASGRYCLFGEIMDFANVLKMLHELYPSIPNLDKYIGELPEVPIFKGSQEKAKSIGINFTSFKVTLKDTIDSAKEKNFF